MTEIGRFHGRLILTMQISVKAIVILRWPLNSLQTTTNSWRHWCLPWRRPHLVALVFTTLRKTDNRDPSFLFPGRGVHWKPRVIIMPTLSSLPRQWRQSWHDDNSLFQCDCLGYVVFVLRHDPTNRYYMNTFIWETLYLTLCTVLYFYQHISFFNKCVQCQFSVAKETLVTLEAFEVNTCF